MRDIVRSLLDERSLVEGFVAADNTLVHVSNKLSAIIIDALLFGSALKLNILNAFQIICCF